MARSSAKRRFRRCWPSTRRRLSRDDDKAMTKNLEHDVVIHPSAVVAPGAQLAAGVKIGPFCHIGADVELDASIECLSHVVVAGRTKIGARTRIFPFASIGHAPQDLKYRGEASALTI